MTTQGKQKYTAEFKESAVKLANESSNMAEIARELGIKENTLYNWVYQYISIAACLSLIRLPERMNICTKN